MAKWKVSALWANKQLLCKPGVYCKGECCHIWDFKRNRHGRCGYLTKDGCGLPLWQRPITCQLFPFRLNEQGTLNLYIRTVQGRMCPGCYGRGPLAVETLIEGLMPYCAPETLEQIREAVEKNQNPVFYIDDSIAARLRREQLSYG